VTSATYDASAAGTWTLADLTINRLGFGAMRLTGSRPFDRDAAPSDRGQAIGVLRRAVELGVNHIDTAAFYFSALRSANELINSALRPYPGDLVITTKVGPGRDPDGNWLGMATPERPAARYGGLDPAHHDREVSPLMRAVVLHEFGGPEQLRLGSAPDPVAGPGQVRVAVHAAGVNPVDAGNRADGSWAGLRLPCILGYDIAGVVDSVGPGVSGLAPGDRVMAMTHFPHGAGGYAELAVIDAALAAPISTDTSVTEAAAMPLAAGTALLVMSRLGLPPGSRLLVLGGSGGVGLFVLQLAAAAGMTTIAVGREAMHERMTGLGATACIDYTREDVVSRCLALAEGPVDAIADLVGGKLVTTAMSAVRNCGQIASIAPPDLDLGEVLDANITLHGVLIQDDGDRTRAVAALRANGALRPIVSHELPLSEAAEAHRILENRHAGGKIVLDVRSR
jgi:NADPH:quinone reductase